MKQLHNIIVTCCFICYEHRILAIDPDEVTLAKLALYPTKELLSFCNRSCSFLLLNVPLLRL